MFRIDFPGNNLSTIEVTQYFDPMSGSTDRRPQFFDRDLQ